MPITTSSAKARDYYLKGRSLAENLRNQEAAELYQKAVEEDTNFALGYLGLAFSQNTAKDFFEYLNKAEALVDQISEGERLWILGSVAGANGQPAKQLEFFEQMVRVHPADERAHNILANLHFGQQDYQKAIAEYRKAREIDSEFAPLYNQLGYSYRRLGRYKEAEKAFRAYIELIPNDPNPYDSYAELLMKIGEFKESIDNYRKALELNPRFGPSRTGIASNLNFLGKHEQARKELATYFAEAEDDGQRRAAIFATAVSYADEGNLDAAIAEIQKQYAIVEKAHDTLTMAGDIGIVGTILIEQGRYREAREQLLEAQRLVEASSASAALKKNTIRGNLYNFGRISVLENDIDAAKANLETYCHEAESEKNPFQIRLGHELRGIIALAEGNYDKALEELKQANQQDPYNVYRMMKAYELMGNMLRARELCEDVVNFNQLNSLNYSFVRNKAKQKLASM